MDVKGGHNSCHSGDINVNLKKTPHVSVQRFFGSAAHLITVV